MVFICLQFRGFKQKVCS